MLVADDDVGLEIIKPFEGLQRAFKVFKRFERTQIADMGAEDDLVPKRQSDGIFLVRPDREDLFLQLKRQGDRAGGEAAGEAEHQRPVAEQLHHRVVAGVDDPAVVGEYAVDDAGEFQLKLGIGPDDRFVAEIGAGGDQRKPDAFEDAAVQRRIRQKNAETVDARCHGGGDAARLSLHQHHGPLFGGDEFFLRVTQRCGIADRIQSGKHKGERFGRTALAFAQKPHTFFIGSVAHQVEAAQPLDGDDLPCFQGFKRLH